MWSEGPPAPFRGYCCSAFSQSSCSHDSSPQPLTFPEIRLSLGLLGVIQLSRLYTSFCFSFALPQSPVTVSTAVVLSKKNEHPFTRNAYTGSLAALNKHIQRYPQTGIKHPRSCGVLVCPWSPFLPLDPPQWALRCQDSLSLTITSSGSGSQCSSRRALLLQLQLLRALQRPAHHRLPSRPVQFMQERAGTAPSPHRTAVPLRGRESQTGLSALHPKPRHACLPHHQRFLSGRRIPNAVATVPPSANTSPFPGERRAAAAARL